MVGLILVTHGNFSQEILNSAELILGKQEKVVTLGLNHGDSIEKLKDDVRKALNELEEGQGVLVLTDLFGGSPTNVTAANMKEKRFECLTGLNLPMLIEALTSRSTCLFEKLAQRCREAGISGIKNLSIELHL